MTLQNYLLKEKGPEDFEVVRDITSPAKSIKIPWKRQP